MGPSAKVIADSLAYGRHRLTTIEVTMHRFVLAEFNTHRMFSRNSASSRAIPVKKRLEQVRQEPALPVVWASEQPGMQGGEELGALDSYEARLEWKAAARNAAVSASRLVELGVHKSIINRLLEPFFWHTVIVSSTEWSNFFRQRCSPLAQPEIMVVAKAMKSVLELSTPRRVEHGNWHLPYMSPEDMVLCEKAGEDPRYVSAARCARVSYLTHDGKRDVQKDAELYHKLTIAEPPHASPLEHVASPSRVEGMGHRGNFTGWMQLRHEELGF